MEERGKSGGDTTAKTAHVIPGRGKRFSYPENLSSEGAAAAAAAAAPAPARFPRCSKKFSLCSNHHYYSVMPKFNLEGNDDGVNIDDRNVDDEVDRVTQSLEQTVRKLSRGSPNMHAATSGSSGGLSGLAKGYEQYRESLLFLHPTTTEYGEASSDDLSSEWDNSDAETNNNNVAATTAAASVASAKRTLQATTSSPVSVAISNIKSLHSLSLPGSPTELDVPSSAQQDATTASRLKMGVSK